MGRLRRSVGALAPTITSIPPGKFFFEMVLPEYLLLVFTRPRSAGVSRSIGVRRSFEKDSPRFTVGCITMMDAGW